MLAMIQKDSAVVARQVADSALEKVNEKIAIIGRKDFDDLAGKSETVINGELSADDYLRQMDSIAADHPDSLRMKQVIQSIKAKRPKK